MEATLILREWVEEKESWVAPVVEDFKISVCTVGARMIPAVSFPKMAEWMLRNREWEERENQLSVSYGDNHLNTVLLWNAFKFREGEGEGETEWHTSPSGSLAHKALPNYCYNTVSFLINLGENRKRVNVKYFVNGSMTLTGCSNMEDARDAIVILRGEFERHRVDWFEESGFELEMVVPCVYRMMNAYFSFGYAMDCLKVYNLCQNTLGLYVSYDPKEYQGVIIYYMWNRNQGVHNGKCQCERECPYTAKRRRGEGENDCVKLTFIVFSTGKVLITGANALEQVQDCFQFFKEQFQLHSKSLVQFSLQDFLKKKMGDEIQPKRKTRRNKDRGDMSLTQFFTTSS